MNTLPDPDLLAVVEVAVVEVGVGALDDDVVVLTLVRSLVPVYVTLTTFSVQAINASNIK